MAMPVCKWIILANKYEKYYSVVLVEEDEKSYWFSRMLLQIARKTMTKLASENAECFLNSTLILHHRSILLIQF